MVPVKAESKAPLLVYSLVDLMVGLKAVLMAEMMVLNLASLSVVSRAE